MAGFKLFGHSQGGAEAIKDRNEKHDSFLTQQMTSGSFSENMVTSVSSVVTQETPHSKDATDLESLEKVIEEWKPHKKEWFIMISMSVIALMVALDATILVTVLPVSQHMPMHWGQ